MPIWYTAVESEQQFFVDCGKERKYGASAAKVRVLLYPHLGRAEGDGGRKS
jgi:hypothetical protein